MDPRSVSDDPVTVANDVFERVLGRAPREDERAFYAGLVEQDPTGLALTTALLDGPEHRALLHGNRFVPSGHFYSPLPSDEEVAASPDMRPRTFAGIDLRADAQRELLSRLAAGYPELPFTDEPTAGLRYHYDNPHYGYSDAIFLASMIREVRPERYIEVGSGNSSCVLLDINDRFFGGSIDVTFIEPYPDYLNGLLDAEEARRIRMLPSRLQDVDLSEFERLAANDILFIDSTHVSKVGSDVNHLFFEILPRLASGVYVHIHDVFGALEYPREWLEQGRAWNEQYLLRAFLEFNAAFEVVLFGNWLIESDRDWFAEHMPACLKNPGGSIWLRRR